MLIKQEFYFHSLDAHRPLHIRIPDFGEPPFPVMYFFDGHNLFRDEDATYGKSWGLDAFCAAPGYRILLCHHPEYYSKYLRDLDIPLILSGHAHGGQVRIFGHGLYSPGQGVLPKLTSGVKDGRLVISRGLANRQKIPRLFNPPEIVYVCG